jgi:hypothetical protein
MKRVCHRNAYTVTLYLGCVLDVVHIMLIPLGPKRINPMHTVQDALYARFLVIQINPVRGRNPEVAHFLFLHKRLSICIFHVRLAILTTVKNFLLHLRVYGTGKSLIVREIVESA